MSIQNAYLLVDFTDLPWVFGLMSKLSFISIQNLLIRPSTNLGHTKDSLDQHSWSFLVLRWMSHLKYCALTCPCGENCSFDVLNYHFVLSISVLGHMCCFDHS